MEPNYYVTTLTNAALKLGPPLLFIVCGYFIFIKLPFLFLKKNMADQKKKLQEDNKNVTVAAAPATEEKVQAKIYALPSQKKVEAKRPEQNKSEQRKTEQKKTEQKKTEPPKRPVPPQEKSPEEVLGFRPNEAISKSELKKRYFDKLKENHPDRVASMGEDFKKLAEKNTKEINKAYDRLKNKAA